MRYHIEIKDDEGSVRIASFLTQEDAETCFHVLLERCPGLRLVEEISMDSGPPLCASILGDD